MALSTEVKVRTVFMTRAHLPEVLLAERNSYAEPFDEAELLRCLRDRDVIGYAAVRSGRVVGYAIVRLHKDKLAVVRGGVRTVYRRVGVGTALLASLQSKLAAGRRRRLEIPVPETHLGTQLFLRSRGVRCEGVLRGRDQSDYLFAHEAAAPESECGGEG